MNIRKILCCAAFLGALIAQASCAGNAGQKHVKLNWIEVSDASALFSQFMCDFTHPVKIESKFNNAEQLLIIKFPHMPLANLKPDSIRRSLAQLQERQLLSEVTLSEEAGVGSTLAIRFAPQSDNTQGGGKLVKLSKIESPHRLIVDIFCADALRSVSQKNNIILQASNDIICNDYSASIPRPRPQDQRIVIDPGHGGKDLGAKSLCGSMEKEIALKIGREVHKLLRADGYNAHLTRSDDSHVSLLARSDLAHQLDADLFVSIHLNSAGRSNHTISGVETYFLDHTGFVPPTHNGGYFFVNMEKDKSLITLANDYIEKNVSVSRNLASCIQNSVIKRLHREKFDATDRGIKAKNIRVLLRNNIPSALVEVGFLTNKLEAARLKNPAYQSLLARGIYMGIKNHLRSSM